MVVLPRAQWSALEADHQARMDAHTAARLSRRDRGAKHPVEDFLYDYYSLKPARLRRWHPGAGVVLAEADRMPRAAWTYYRVGPEGLEVDVDAFLTVRGDAVRFGRDLLTATSGRPAAYGCFALHEWAMVHGLTQDQVRHRAWPLRVSPARVHQVLAELPVRCTHFDAFRFFTPSAIPLNQVQPTRDRQLELEQPGCLHAGMDLLKWSTRLAPAVPSEIMADAFELALRIRELDMQAAPYDVRDLGVQPLEVETVAGRAEFVVRQRALAEDGGALRQRLLGVLDRLLDRQDVGARD